MSKTKTVAPVATVKEQPAATFVPASRNDGVPSHNLEWTEAADGYLYLRIKMDAATTPAKSGNPLISTTRGFVILGSKGNINLSLNALKKGA